MGTVENLGEMIEYQEGSVVSKTIMDKQTGTVTLFAFGKAEGLSEHTAPFNAMVYIVDGQAEVTISGKQHHLAAGEMMIMPANEPHALSAPEQFKMMLVMIKA